MVMVQIVMTHTQQIIKGLAVVTGSAVLSATGVVLADGALAAGTCGPGDRVVRPTARLNAFAGHRVEATGKLCVKLRNGAPVGVSHTSEVTVRLPSTVPAGAGESVTLVDKPKLVHEGAYRHSYRFTVQSKPSYLPKVGQTFSFDVHYYADGSSQICFTGRACGPSTPAIR